MPPAPQIVLALFHDYRPPNDRMRTDEFHKPVLNMYRAPALRVHLQVPKIPHLPAGAVAHQFAMEAQACQRRVRVCVEFDLSFDLTLRVKKLI